METNKYLIFSH